MTELWSVQRPLIRRTEVPVEVGAVDMGPGFRLQELVDTKTFMWDHDSMAPRLGTPFHSHHQDEAWQAVSEHGVSRTDHGAISLTAGDDVLLPGGQRHQMASLSATEPLVCQGMLVPRSHRAPS